MLTLDDHVFNDDEMLMKQLVELQVMHVAEMLAKIKMLLKLHSLQLQSHYSFQEAFALGHFLVFHFVPLLLFMLSPFLRANFKAPKQGHSY